ncbi:MAG: hypothetical protein ACOCZ8_04480, partial [Bacteroidota bacterium]
MNHERLFSFHDAGLGSLWVLVPMLAVLLLLGWGYFTTQLREYVVDILKASALSAIGFTAILFLIYQFEAVEFGDEYSWPSVWQYLGIAFILSFQTALFSVGYFVVQRVRSPAPQPFRLKLQKFAILFGVVMLALGISRGLWFTGVCFGLVGVLLGLELLLKTELTSDVRFYQQWLGMILSAFILFMLFFPPGMQFAPAYRIEFPTIQGWPVGLFFAGFF